MTSQVYSHRNIIGQSVPILIVCLLIDIQAGIFLNLEPNLRIFKEWPSFLIILPAIIAITGNIGSIFGSRLTSSLYLGEIRPRLERNITLEKSILATILIGTISFLLIGLAAWIIGRQLGLNQPTLINYLLITTTSGLILTLFASLLAISSSFITYKKGIDPDNIVIPTVTSLGDLVGVAFFLLIIRIVIPVV